MGLVIDNFAGGGGASHGIKMAIGRDPDIAINHDAVAIATHKANHPNCLHIVDDVFKVQPRDIVGNREVDLAWFSPDCRHHSKAKGGKPNRSRKIRGLAWVAVKYAVQVKPKVIVLENVEEFQDWGQLDDKGRPDPKKKGVYFKLFIARLRNLGYDVDFRELVACDYGAPTSRKRFFMIARCDGEPIVWPKKTHGPGCKYPYKTAADCIDWSIPTVSIFADPAELKRLGINARRPLAEKTMDRIAKGLKKFVFDNPEPFVMAIDHQGSQGSCSNGLDEPLSTVVTKNRHALVTPFIGRQFGQSVGGSVRSPFPTITAGGGGHAQLVAAFLAKHYTGVVGSDIKTPLHTITTSDHHSLVTSNIVKFRGDNVGQKTDMPLQTITSSGKHHALLNAFFVKYYGSGIGQDACEPLHTVTTKERFGLVTVQGQEYVIQDIGLRMLKPHELKKAQGFDDDYKLLGNSTQQVRLIGNSVAPQVAAAIIRANVPEMVKVAA